MVKGINKIRDIGKKPEPEAEPTTKECPFCKSEINIEATRCPNCTSQLKGENE
jgi:large conductance mechanosensitive channel